MVKIRVFIPHLDLKEIFEDVLSKLPKYDNVKVEMKYIFGTPEALLENWDADILVARGMTHDVLTEHFPNKYITKIQFNSFDVINALLQCKKYDAKKIALCVHNFDIPNLLEIEKICNAKIKIFDAFDEEMAQKSIKIAVDEGFDIFVGAGTVCGICDMMKLKRVHIKTKHDAVENALKDALDAAKTINNERTRSNIIKTMLNTSVEGVIAINDKGEILEINNQAYRVFQLSISNDLKGKLAGSLVVSDKWQELLENKLNDEKIISIYGKSYLVQYKFLDNNNSETGAIIFIRNTDRIIEEEIKIRRKLSSKGLTAKYCFDDIIGSSKSIVELKKIAKRFSMVNSNVLIIGETGTGKELFAHSMHISSKRKERPFVVLNCAALPENLLESELFGYESGAFSGASKDGKIGLFEQAHTGTIFLDEVGEIPIALQAKLLRVLQEKEIRRIGSTTVQPIDVRVISATNINIDEKIKAGEFRQDLYYRLNLLDIIILPLRERKEDLEELIDLYLTKLACDLGKSMPVITPDALNILKMHDWPGNVRELRNICERLMVLNETDIIDSNFLEYIKFKPICTNCISKSKPNDKYNEEHFQVKKKKKDLAKELGVSRTTLWRMTKRKEKNIDEID